MDSLLNLLMFRSLRGVYHYYWKRAVSINYSLYHNDTVTNPLVCPEENLCLNKNRYSNLISCKLELMRDCVHWCDMMLGGNLRR